MSEGIVDPSGHPVESETLGFIGVEGPNLYKSIHTRNAELAKFTDENHEVAKLFKKVIGLLAGIASDWRVDARRLKFDVMASPDGKMLAIRIMKR